MKSKKQVLGTETGKYCLDVSKLIIGGVILASIVKEDIDSMFLIGIGFVFVIFLTLLGLWLISHYNEKDETKPETPKRKKKYFRRTNNRRN